MVLRSGADACYGCHTGSTAVGTASICDGGRGSCNDRGTDGLISMGRRLQCYRRNNNQAEMDQQCNKPSVGCGRAKIPRHESRLRIGESRPKVVGTHHPAGIEFLFGIGCSISPDPIGNGLVAFAMIG